jgi:hypothetical protein
MEALAVLDVADRAIQIARKALLTFTGKIDKAQAEDPGAAKAA